MSPPRIAVLIPCFNEGLTIEKVINDCKKALPQASIYVYDNGSTDNTVNLAISAGATVKHVPMRGKGHVVRRMFADIDADIYTMVDGDDTYDINRAKEAIELLQTKELDMVVCTRKAVNEHSFRFGHSQGNKWFTKTVNFLFGDQFKDIFSGYRIFSRRFVKSFPAISQGFEIEAEMTIHALQLCLPSGEIETTYQERPAGSTSKLKTIKDGIRILRTILMLFTYIRPMLLFTTLFAVFATLSLLLGMPLIIHFFQTGLVPRFPTAIMAASLGLLATLCLACGIILDSISRSRLEIKRCWYLLAVQQQ